MQDKADDKQVASDAPVTIPEYNEDTPGEEIIAKLRDLDKNDVEFEAVRDEFLRRAKNFNMDDVSIDLLIKEPFYGAIARRVSKVRSWRVPTAAVTVLNDTFLMMWNASFFTRIAPDADNGAKFRKKAVGVLMHEYLHLVLEHTLNRSYGMKYPVLANWAFDLAINCMIDRKFLPDGLLIPGEKWEMPEDLETIYRPEEVEQYKQLSGFIETLPPKKAAEWYYNELLEFIESNMPDMLSNPDWGKPMDQQGDNDQECPQCGGSGQCDPNQQGQDGQDGQQGQQGQPGQDGQSGQQGQCGSQGCGHGDHSQEGQGQGQGQEGQEGQGQGQGQKPHDVRGQGDAQGQGSASGQKASQQGGQGQGQGQPQQCPSCTGSGKGIPDSVKKGYGRLGNFDSHDEWDQVSSKEREFIRQRVKNMLRDAVNEADNSASWNGWGSVPSELQQLIRKLISTQVDWRALLRQFVGYSQHMNKSSTIKRINKRFPYIHPGTRRSRGATLWVYIDQSGSVDDEAIALLFGELDNLAKKVNFRVYFFDTEVDEDYIDWRRGQKHPAQRHRMGGTDFDAPTRHANEHKDEMDGYLILSDGECSRPGPSIKKRGWIIVPDRKLHFETDELVIQMTRDDEKKPQ